MFDKTKVLDLYRKYGIKPSKRFGQNFLIDQNIVEVIIESSQIENKEVIEIGPGLGALTRELLKVSNNVTAYEIDPDMQKVLSNEINAENFILKSEDFLEANFNWGNKRSIVANIPYNITSPILFKIFKSNNKFDTATLMVQKEVALRLLANPNESNYGKLTVTTNYLADVEPVIIVPASSFLPSPKVDSMVIKLTFKEQTHDSNITEFFKLCFSQQRKTLINNLKFKYPKEKLLVIIKLLGLKENIRPQQLSLNQFIKFYNSL